MTNLEIERDGMLDRVEKFAQKQLAARFVLEPTSVTAMRRVIVSRMRGELADAMMVKLLRRELKEEEEPGSPNRT
jgi:hypothetical protein